MAPTPDQSLRPYGTQELSEGTAPLGTRRRVCCFAPIGIQLVLFGLLVGQETGVLPSMTDDYLMQYGWICSLVSLVVAVLAYAGLGRRRQLSDILIGGLNGTVGVLGLLWWGFLAVALMAVGV